MILDAQLLFSDAQALTGTAASTNLIDLGVDRDIGSGQPLAVCIDVDVAADTTSGNETYQFDLETDDNSGFSSAVVLARRIIDKASLTAGTKWVMGLPNDNERYLRLNYTLGGTTPAITVTAYLIGREDIDKQANYASGFSIA